MLKVKRLPKDAYVNHVDLSKGFPTSIFYYLDLFTSIYYLVSM